MILLWWHKVQNAHLCVPAGLFILEHTVVTYILAALNLRKIKVQLGDRPALMTVSLYRSKLQSIPKRISLKSSEASMYM